MSPDMGEAKWAGSLSPRGGKKSGWPFQRRLLGPITGSGRTRSSARVDWRTARQRGQHGTENGRHTVRGFGFYSKAKPRGGVSPTGGSGSDVSSALTHCSLDEAQGKGGLPSSLMKP